MPKPCSVCISPHRAEIDRALVKGATVRALEKKFVGLSRAAIHRHKLNCTGLPPVGTKEAREARREISHGTVALATLPSRDDLGGMYLDVRQRLHAIVERAEQQGTGALSVAGLNAVRQTLDSLSRLAGHTGQAPQVSVGVQVNISAGEIAAELARRYDHAGGRRGSPSPRCAISEGYAISAYPHAQGDGPPWSLTATSGSMSIRKRLP